jgi:hypothetical protein
VGGVDAQPDMIDARGSLSRRSGTRRLDQMDGRLAIRVEPVAPDAEGRARTFAETDDGAKKAPCGFEVPGDDCCVIKFHAAILRRLRHFDNWRIL